MKNEKYFTTNYETIVWCEKSKFRQLLSIKNYTLWYAIYKTYIHLVVECKSFCHDMNCFPCFWERIPAHLF